MAWVPGTPLKWSCGCTFKCQSNSSKISTEFKWCKLNKWNVVFLMSDTIVFLTETLVLFSSCPKNCVRKCLCKLRTLKPLCINNSVLPLDFLHVYSATVLPSYPNSTLLSLKLQLLWKTMSKLSEPIRKHPWLWCRKPHITSHVFCPLPWIPSFFHIWMS